MKIFKPSLREFEARVTRRLLIPPIEWLDGFDICASSIRCDSNLNFEAVVRVFHATLTTTFQLDGVIRFQFDES